MAELEYPLSFGLDPVEQSEAGLRAGEEAL